MANTKHSPILAGTPGALKDVKTNPYLQDAMRNGVNKDVWGSDWTSFMGIDNSGNASEVGASSADYLRVSQNESVVYCCIDIRGAAIASVPLKVYDSEDQDTRHEVDHEALDILEATNPFGWANGDQLWRYSIGARDLFGHTAWQLALDSRGLPAEIYWLTPDSYKTYRDSNGFLGGLKKKVDGGEQTIPRNQIFYAPTANIANPLAGTSKIAVLRNQLTLRAYSQQSNIDFFRNGMRPDWLLTGDFAQTEENVSGIRRQLKKWLGGGKEKGPIILGGNYQAHLLTANPKDAEWIQQQKISREDILAAFRVPPPVYGDLERATYENIGAAFEQFWQTGMIPEMDELADMLTVQFLWRWPDAKKAKLRFGFDYAQIEALQEDANAIWQRLLALQEKVVQAVQTRLLTPNQARVLLAEQAKKLGTDFNPFSGTVPGGDTFYVGLHEVPINEAGVQANIDVNAARIPDTVPQTHKPTPGQWELPSHAVPSEVPQSTEPQPPPTLSRTRKAKDRSVPHSRIRDVRLQPAQDYMRRKLQKHFQDLQTESLRTLRSLPENAIPHVKSDEDVSDLWNGELSQEGLTGIVRKGIALSGQAAYEAAKEDYQLDVSWADDHPFVDKQLGNRLSMVKGIDDTLRDSIRTAIKNGVEAEEGIPGITTRITDVFTEASDSRAEMIARTETVNAYGKASLDAYEAANLEKAEMYDGDGDEECAAVNGQIVTLDEADSLMDDEHPNGHRGVSPYFEEVDTTGDNTEEMIYQALEAVRKQGGPAPIINIINTPDIHQPNVNVTTPDVTVNNPPINVTTPDVKVDVQSPEIKIPEQKAPNVTVNVPESKPRKARFKTNAKGEVIGVDTD